MNIKNAGYIHFVSNVSTFLKIENYIVLLHISQKSTDKTVQSHHRQALFQTLK